MINRYRQHFAQLDPTIYKYNPQEILPDLSVVDKMSSYLQSSYDALSKVPRPLHIDNDAPLVNDLYIKPLEQYKNKAVEAFKQGNVSDGINLLKQADSFLYEAKQPGGVFHSFEDNYKRANDYMTELSKNKDINKDTRDFSVRKSLQDFTTYGQNGQKQTFQGYVPAKDVDLNNYFDGLVKGWAETEFSKGYRKTANGQYIEQISGKKVDKNEILKSLYQAFPNNPELAPYVNQLKEMYGDKAAQGRITSAIDYAADKYAFNSEKVSWHSDKDYDYSNTIKGIKYKYDLENPTLHQTTAPFKYSATGATPITEKDGRVQIGETKNTFQVGNVGALGAQTKTTDSYLPVYTTKGFNELLDSKKPNDQQIFRAKPGLEELVRQTPATGKTPQEYNKLITKNYNQFLENSLRVMNTTDLPPKRQKEIMETMVGKGKEDSGALINFKLTELSNTAAPRVISNDEVTKKKGETNLNIYGQTNGGNGFFPGSYMAILKTGDRIRRVVIEPKSYEEAVHYTPLKGLLQPRITGQSSGWNQVSFPGTGTVVLRSKPVFVNDEQGNFQDIELEFYKATKFDKKGKPIAEEKVDPSLVNVKNLQSAFEKFDPSKQQ